MTVLSLACAGVGAVVSAPVAQATLPGCNTPQTSFSSPGGLLTGHTSASCSGSATRTLVAEIKWDKRFLPDPLVASNSDHGDKSSYSSTVTTCDNGNQRGYYARGFFSQDGTHYDTAPQVVSAC